MRPILIVLALATAALAQERTVKGTVENEKYEPLEGATVVAWKSTSMPATPRELARIHPMIRFAAARRGLEIAGVGTSSATGEFSFPVEERVDFLTARNGEFAAFWEVAPDRRTGSPIEARLWLGTRVARTSLTVRSEAGPVSNARVVVRQTRRPVYRCSVSRYTDWRPSTEWETSTSRTTDDLRVDDFLEYEVETDENGLAEFDLACGEVLSSGWIKVSRAGMGTVHSRLRDGDVRIRLEAEADVSGTVLDASGRPIVAELTAFEKFAWTETLRSARTSTDELGHFRFSRLASKHTYVIDVVPATPGSGARTLNVRAPSSVEIVLPRTGSLDVGVSVGAIGSFARGRRELVLGGDGTSASGEPWSGRVNAQIVVEKEGSRAATADLRFELDERARALPTAHFPSLPEGRYRIHLEATECAPATSEVEVVAGKKARVEMKLAVTPTRSLSVKVTDAARKPLSAAFVSVPHRDGVTIVAIGHEGTWIFDVPSKALRLTFSCTGFEEKVVEVKEGVTEIEVVLDRE